MLGSNIISRVGAQHLQLY